MILTVNLPLEAYDIVIEEGVLTRGGELLNLKRRCLVVTDEGVPEEYAKTLVKSCALPTLITLPQGESSKSLKNLELLWTVMHNEGFTRSDCVVAVGGGVVGDLAGFAAACYMRGVDFYNIPTTLLAQVDSSVGGKTAIDFCGTKNIIGAFHQPKKVLIDPLVLKTLPPRHISAGLAEALKMALTSDRELYGIFKEGKAKEKLAEVIERALRIKISVVEQDEKEAGLRRILNFGHTFGHGIEALQGEDGLYHGECVALGMIPMCGDGIRAEVTDILKALGLPTVLPVELEAALAFADHDKKCVTDGVNTVRVDTVGEYIMEKMSLDEWKQLVRERVGGKA
ncbi:MAG: 3-dehydroquinate synthase [Ruminococcaceae bacterium]|nr:3-dehydroquinate synthase [Oscillospiraceae bacterium]